MASGIEMVRVRCFSSFGQTTRGYLPCSFVRAANSADPKHFMYYAVLNFTYILCSSGHLNLILYERWCGSEILLSRSFGNIRTIQDLLFFMSVTLLFWCRAVTYSSCRGRTSLAYRLYQVRYGFPYHVIFLHANLGMLCYKELIHRLFLPNNLYQLHCLPFR